jgi:hypothetical protein
VYDLVAWWTAEGRETGRSRRALRLWCLDASGREDPFAAVIRCTADAAKADKRTRSKWSRVMRYGAALRGLQAEFRAAGPVRQAERRHQRLCCSILSAPGATCGK